MRGSEPLLDLQANQALDSTETAAGSKKEITPKGVISFFGAGSGGIILTICSVSRETDYTIYSALLKIRHELGTKVLRRYKNAPTV